QIRWISLGLLRDLGHPATALLGPHPELESQTTMKRNHRSRLFQTASQKQTFWNTIIPAWEALSSTGAFRPFRSPQVSQVGLSAR
ncbi:MAG: hypothetical protein Q8M88_04855, partial [Phenylobacterium sp.]|uniref:hypothetical protein n=1 Tax=Phenylobacterium sp. TaxID=1871053 RepID=UPI002736C50A